jgi:hypothetical protein
MLAIEAAIRRIKKRPPRRVHLRNYPVVMANPKHTIHVGIAVAGVLVGAVLSVFTGDPAVALMFSGGAMSSIGYWLGASAQRRHG